MSGKEQAMGVSKKIKMVLLDKEIQQKELAERLGYEGKNTIYNMLKRDNMTYATVEKWADLLDCDVVLKDRKTGKIYE